MDKQKWAQQVHQLALAIEDDEYQTASNMLEFIAGSMYTDTDGRLYQTMKEEVKKVLLEAGIDPEAKRVECED